MPCSQDDCPCDPVWRPILELRSHRGAKPERVSFSQLGYCEAHKQTANLAAFLSDEGFTKLTKFLREAGHEPPDRQLTTLGWAAISPAEASALASDQHHTLSPEETLAF